MKVLLLEKVYVVNVLGNIFYIYQLRAICDTAYLFGWFDQVYNAILNIHNNFLLTNFMLMY